MNVIICIEYLMKCSMSKGPGKRDPVIRDLLVGLKRSKESGVPKLNI